jgi:GNAT superfamily N-acetyltransferase
MTGPGMTLRRARPDDLEGVVEVFLRCWHETYARTLPARLVGLMSRDRAEALWRRVLGEDHGQVIVALDQNLVRGLTRCARLDDGSGMVHSLYVDPLAQGTGVGAQLLASAESWLASAGASRGLLWVFDANEPSIGFYHHQGWAEDGTTRTTEEFGELERRLTKEWPAARTVLS